MLDRFTASELRWAIDGSGFGIWSWDLRADKIRWSSQLGEIYGVEPENFPDNVAALSAMLPLSISDNLQAQIISSADQESGQFAFEHPIIRPGNQTGWVRNTGQIEFDKNRRATSLVAIAADITKQKQTDHLVKTQEQHFLRLCELTADYIFEVDVTVEPFVPHTVAGSYERVVGYTAAELKAKGGWKGIMNPEDLQSGLEVWKQLQSGVPTIHEYRIINKHGETRWLRDHSHPTMIDGKLTKLVGGVKDITETKVLQDQLIQTQKHEAMAHLVGSVAHDFNNLLFVVSATTEVITPKSVDLEELKADIYLACNRAADLSRSLLAFSGKDLPQVKTIRLSDAINGASDMLSRAAGKQINIRINCSAGINDKVDIDPGHLQLMLLNMTANARAAMRNQGELLISISAVDAHTIDLPQMDINQTVALTVTDSGCGIPDQHLHRVFDPFFSTKPPGEGTGIGLATCWQIVEAVGGAIQVKNNPSQGVTFTIYLPAVHSAAREERAPSGQFSFGGKERILIVQNDPDVQRVTVRILKTYGYDASGADSAKNAHQAVADGNYDLLIVDTHLPDSDGLSFVRNLRNSDYSTPVLLISGYINDKTRAEIRADGHNVLPKPFSPTALARSVRATLSV